MRYYKLVEDGYIIAIGTGLDGVEIAAEEYKHIKECMLNRPEPPEGYDYRLREDLTWEECELPIIDPVEEEISDSEALAIILGGDA